MQEIPGYGSESGTSTMVGDPACFRTLFNYPHARALGQEGELPWQSWPPATFSPPPPHSLQIFRDLSQDPTEDIFLTELKVKIQDSKFPKGERLSPLSQSRLTQLSPPQALFPESPPTPHLHGIPGCPWLLQACPDRCFLPSRGTCCQIQELSSPSVRWGAGQEGREGREAPIRSLSSPCPSDGFSPRRKGAAEGPGAELSICYQKVRGHGRSCSEEVGGYGGVEAGVRDGAGGEHTEPEEPSTCFPEPAPPPAPPPQLLPPFGEVCRDGWITVVACSPGGHLT